MLKVKVIMASNSPKGLGIYIMHFFYENQLFLFRTKRIFFLKLTLALTNWSSPIIKIRYEKFLHFKFCARFVAKSTITLA